jgi:hypothetical protein
MIQTDQPFIQTIDQPVSTPQLPDQDLKDLPTPPRKVKPALLALFGLISILIILLILSIFFKNPPNISQKEGPINTTPQPQQPSSSTQTDLEKEIENIKTLIQDEQIVPLPKIDLDISL